MFPSRTLRRSLLTVATAVTLCVTAAPLGLADTPSASPDAIRPAAAPGPGAAAPDPHDRADRLAKAPKPSAKQIPAPGGLTDGRVPGPRTPKPKHKSAAAGCTLDDVTRLSPEAFADFLADPAVTADGCLRSLIWTWDRRLAPVMSDAHVQAVSRRIGSLAAGHDGKNGSHLLEMFTYLHAVAYHDFSRDEIDVTDPPTVAAMRAAVDAFGTAARTFDVTPANAQTLREALYAAGAPGLRQHQLPLIKRVLKTMDADRPATHKDRAWAGAALAALSLNYLGVYPGNKDTAFHTAVAADPSYRAAFKAFAGHTHLKGTENDWVVRDALLEYGRLGQIDAIRAEIVAGLGPLLGVTARNFGDLSAPWAKVATWLVEFDACAPYKVCREDIEKRLFPRTDSYGKQGSDGIVVRSALDRATVDQLYYASRQVKAQFHRVVGSQEPLAGDPNSNLRVVLYASRAQYENFQPLLTGLSTDNGGMYIEKGATFYTYQRRVPQDSSLTLEELFRHEYTHYLNGRWAVPGFFGEGPWYQGDRTTAMDEGTAEFFDGATRDDGIKVRKSLVKSIIADTANGGPRMTVNQILHATYDGDGFRFYSYAGTFFEYLWTERPALLKEMYRLLRADNPAGFDAWRDRLGRDTNLQRGYDAFLDQQIKNVDDLFVPDTKYVPVEKLHATSSARVRDSFKATTGMTPQCAPGGSKDRPTFACTGRVTARLTGATNPDLVFKDMSETVDYFILDRSKSGDNNLTDMNCSFGEVQIWSDGRGGTSDFRCEGPLRG
ncbi:collagenase [Streptomyces aurantiacus]|uniref:microbial collagenase n=1 Tax=Streptomyces aurantiacus JA 4570 TaxID=1286094 RepID=S3ZT22_9ACTN|nr:collagenase [Streptomyces aurantiacus]EPH41550.1 putative Microbial collagenase [Streptomyces aurantiacus JA 4570]